MLVRTYKGVVVIEKDNEAALFDPESFVVFTPKEMGKCEESINAFLEKKSNIKQIAHIQEKKHASIEKIQACSTRKKNLLIYWLITNNCNLRCSYCFADGGSYGQSRGFMDKQTIEKTLHLLYKDFSDVDEFNILFFGGEPCLYPELIEYTINKAKEILKDKKLIFSGTTNGTVLSEKLQAIFEKHKVSFAISLDGPECAQNCLRRTATGIGSYDLVKNNLNTFKDINKKLPILVTVTPKNMNLVDTYFHFKKLGVTFVRFTPATVPTESNLCFSESDVEFLKSQFSELASIYVKDLLEEERPLIIDNFSSIRTILLRQKRRSFCNLGNGIIAVTPQGDLYPCPHFVGEEQYCMGNVYTKFDKEAYKKYFHANNVEKKPTCSTCPVKNLCGGDCYHYIDNKYNGANNQSSIICKIFEHQVHLSVWIYAKLYKAGYFEKNINKPYRITNAKNSSAAEKECQP